MSGPPPTQPIRLAVLATHTIQYQVPVWRALAARSDLRVQVFFGSDLGTRSYHDGGFGREIKWDIPTTEGYPHAFLSRNPALQTVTPWRPGARGLVRKLREFCPDAVLLNAYGARFWVEALLVARMLRLPVVLRHEASDVAVSRSPAKSRVRDMILRIFYAQITAFAAIGLRAREHLLRLGVPAAAITSAPYNVDSDFFEAEAARWLPQREALRAGLGIAPHDVAFVFSGKMIPKKDPELVLAAIRRLPETVQRRIHWLALGDGELRGSLSEQARALCGSRASFPGFVNQRDLGRWYAAADCLIRPSRAGHGETWGLVVNEAFHFGLPAIVSDGVGCQPDLVPDDRTGRIFPSANVDSLATAIRDMAGELPAARTRYTEAVKNQISQFTTARAADGIVAAATLATGTSKIRTS